MKENSVNFLTNIDFKLEEIVKILNSPEEKVMFWVAIIALIVAIGSLIFEFWGSKKSREEFKINLKEQQRSNDISLFDKRQEILESIKSGDFSFSLDRVELLFNEEILGEIKQYKSMKEERGKLLDKYNRYRDNIHIVDIEPDIKEDLIKAIVTYDAQKNESEDDAMFEEACRFIKNNTLIIDGIPCDYVTLDENIQQCSLYLQKCKAKIEDDIKEFIKKSISR